MTSPEGDTNAVTAQLRIRIGQEEAHYGGELVDGARLLRLFGDLVTEITIRTDGDEGLLAEYSDVRFTAPVRPGDYIEATAQLVRSTKLRRFVALEARKVIASCDTSPSAAQPLAEPITVCTANAVTVVPKPKRSSSPDGSRHQSEKDTVLTGGR
ncbi:3-aminobutyryl-CoA ammonia lyase [Streptomyces caelestis]|uniref:3-aminobutyryl-CoA ammonia lyase n=2 Tax=Streptomyces TaxID=1883 RepID=A0A0M8QCM5_9ACTN|nr:MULTISPECIES: hotdog fold domain-containing protein [Streptomyces]KOT28296.1 3-aminobutyryl-CoA ammonia lyase [Streptomyces caelestis]KOV19007.1 3-aminobutyryl-CoA ammonia lyase [Streptomyces sp. XY152]